MTDRKIARIYLRVSTDEQDLDRQKTLINEAEKAGYYIAGTYEDKASGITLDRPGLNKLLSDLRPGDVIIAEHIDRLSRLPIAEARKLVAIIKEKQAVLAINGLAAVDFKQLANYSDMPEISKIVLEKVQDMLLEIALELANNDYEQRRKRTLEGIARAKKAGRYRGRPPDKRAHKQIIEFSLAGHKNKKIAELVGCSVSLVEKIKSQNQKTQNEKSKKTTL